MLPVQKSLEVLRQNEANFRSMAREGGFVETPLPLCAPIKLFKSRLTGTPQLAAGPTFIDGFGEEWALRSDFTAFAVQHVLEHWAQLNFPLKISYCGKVFHAAKGNNGVGDNSLGSKHGSFKGFKKSFDQGLESIEFGLEILGRGEIEADLEVLKMGLELAKSFGIQNLHLVVGDSRISKTLFEAITALSDVEKRLDLFDLMECAFRTADTALFEKLFAKHKMLSEIFEEASRNSPAQKFVEILKKQMPLAVVYFDPYLKRAQSFYSGLTFEIFGSDARGNLCSVGGGGRYDKSFDHFGKSVPAVGLMLKDPSLLQLQPAKETTKRVVRIALPKGRLLEPALAAFAAVGVVPKSDPKASRALVLLSQCGNFEFLFVKNADVATYLETGVADLTVAGSDVLDEAKGDELRPATFGFGSCRICLAGRPDQKQEMSSGKRVRIATKYGELTQRLLRKKGVAVEIVSLQGSVELASVIDMADAIVDLVETGSTLRDNGLVVFEDLETTSVQLACSRGIYYEKNQMIKGWIDIWKSKGLAK